ncbi:MAG: hypothetical protein JWN33_237 [Candidatus Saccharibacteria bacterium]|nr:hypothetical protein [Candidatus Saccharibacteria bacterium]
MNKDVIYIDVEDDITAIIGKVKASKEKIVAIVPPRRAGVLQSAVNLHLLQRMAKTDKKHLVIITHNQALMSLAAAAQIPVAKNLQSKPEIAAAPVSDDDADDDIIDGAQLPVGDLARTADNASKDNDEIDSGSAALSTRHIRVTGAGTAAASAGATAKKSTGSKIKIPNFDSFRKKLFLGISAAALLIGILIWAIWFAPAAKVIITAQTSSIPVSSTVELAPAGSSDNDRLPSVSKQSKKDETIEFNATGQKDLGTAATGTVKFSTNSINALGTTIPAGTRLTTSSDLVFTTDEAVTITISNYTGANVGITAAAGGTDYNGESGAVSGAPSNIQASLVGQTSGGTSRIVKVVSQDDIDRASGDIIGRSTLDQKKALIKEFDGSVKVIDSSFTSERGTPVSAPTVGQEAPASGKATLTVPTTYTMTGVAKKDLETFLTDALNTQILNKNERRIYDTGINSAKLSDYVKQGEKASVTVGATGKLGPKIDESQVKEQVKGKIFGDVQASLENIEGVENVDIKFSYFWVRTVPNNTDKIDIEFKLNE